MYVSDPFFFFFFSWDFSNGINVLAVGGSFQTKFGVVLQDIRETTTPNVRLEDLGIDRIPPTMGTLDNNFEIVGVNVQLVL